MCIRDRIMDGLNRIVKAGKARYIGISNCFAWQLCMANELAEREGFAKFVSVQGHYNLIFREEEDVYKRQQLRLPFRPTMGLTKEKSMV